MHGSLQDAPIQADDDADWARRCSHWHQLSVHALPPRRRRERSSKMLILCGHGVSLRVEGGTLLIKNGFTHYPQQRDEYRYFQGDLDRPARIIVLDGSGRKCVKPFLIRSVPPSTRK